MGKSLLITGASSDIGCELIKNIESDYDRIYAHYRTAGETGFDELVKKYPEKIIPIQADFGDRSSVSLMIDEMTGKQMIPDDIVHLAAYRTVNVKFHKFETDEFDRQLEISFYSIVQILKAFIPYMMKKKNGRIVFMLSSATIGMPPKYQAPYVAAKYATLGLMKSLAAEYADKNIMINGVSPEMTDTKFLAEVPHLIQEQNAMNSPLGRNLTTSEVIGAIKFLLSDSASVITGQNIGITGGME